MRPDGRAVTSVAADWVRLGWRAERGLLPGGGPPRAGTEAVHEKVLEAVLVDVNEARMGHERHYMRDVPRRDLI